MIKKQDASKKPVKTITVSTLNENEAPIEIIAENIAKIAKAMETINSGRLKKRTVLILIQDITGCSLKDIDNILQAAQELDKHFLKS
jgi:hypothetical protein